MMPRKYFRPADSRSPDFLAIGCLILMVLWFNEELLLEGKAPFFRDLGPYFYPMRFYLAQSFQAGELPLWNRHVSMGYPFLANPQAAVFYPPHLLFLVTSFFDAIRFLFVFHYGIALLGSYLLCRRWNHPPYLALVGAILFSFGGAIVSLTNLLDHFQTAVWLPWTLLFWERFLGSGNRRDFLALVAALLFQLLAGSPEVYALGLAVLLLDGVRVMRGEIRPSYRRLILCFLAANTLVAGLAMVQLAPTFELFLQSWRSQDIPYERVAAWSLQPLRLLNLIFLDKEIDRGIYNGVRLFFAQEPPLLISLYAGAIVPFGLCLWTRQGRAGTRMMLLGLLILTLILAMGGHTPVHRYFYEYVPPFRWIRFPEKLFLFAHALLCFMTLEGLRSFLEERNGFSRLSMAILTAVAILLAGLSIYIRLRHEPLLHFMAWARQFPASDFYDLRSVSGIVFSAERQAILAIGILLLLGLFRMGRLGAAVFRPLLVGLVLLDLASAHRPYQLAVDPNLALRAPTILPAPDPEPYRLVYFQDPTHLHPNAYTFTKREFPFTVSSVFATLIPNTGVLHGFDYMQELDALGRKPYHLFLEIARGLSPDGLYRMLGVLNVKYVNTFQPLSERGIDLLRNFPQYPSRLYRVDRPVPRTYIVDRAIVEEDPVRTLNRISSETFTPLREVILERPLRKPPAANFLGRSNIVQYGSRRILIRASLNSAGILVLADSFYPGWGVYVDGQNSEILKANLFFRAVSLPRGDHLVEFRYEPRSFTLGAAISALTAVGILAAAALVPARRKT